MVRVSGRPATARSVERQQHRLRLYGGTATGVCPGGRRQLRIRGRGTGGTSYRGGHRQIRLVATDDRRPEGQTRRAAERLECELPAARSPAEGGLALRGYPAGLSAACG